MKLSGLSLNEKRFYYVEVYHRMSSVSSSLVQAMGKISLNFEVPSLVIAHGYQELLFLRASFLCQGQGG